MASDPGLLPLLLEAGVREVSVAIAGVAAVKQAVRQWRARTDDAK